MLARLVTLSYNRALLLQRVHTAPVCRPLKAFGVVRLASRQAPPLDLRTRHRRAMTTLAESVGRENIPEPAAKLQKLSPPPEPPLLVKKLSEHATIPTRGSAKAAGYDLSRWGRLKVTMGVGTMSLRSVRSCAVALTAVQCSVRALTLVPSPHCQRPL